MTTDTSLDGTAARAEARRVSDRYELREVVGRGGSAEVWLAVDLVLERPVAVKLLHRRPDLDLDKMTERFLREARIAASVRHPNVVEVLDFGVHAGRPFTVLEFLEGESLHECLTRDPPSPAGLVRIMIAVLDGLDAVHRTGIVHRDVKPENIFLVPRAGGVWPKLLDFGVSRAGEGAGGRRTTHEGMLVGTPEYMSPEQARGSRELDRRTDIYSAGVLLYEATAGFVPYRADGVGDLIIDIVAGAAPTLAEVCDAPEPLSELVAKAMAVDPDDRFPTAAHMRDALVRLEGKLPRETPRGRAILPHRPRSSLPTRAGRGSDRTPIASPETTAVRQRIGFDSGPPLAPSGMPTAPPRGTLTASPPQSVRDSERRSMPTPTLPVRSGRGTMLAVALGLVAAVGGAAWLMASGDDPVPVANEEVEAPAPSASPAVEEPAPPSAEPLRSPPVVTEAEPTAEDAPPEPPAVVEPEPVRRRTTPTRGRPATAEVEAPARPGEPSRARAPRVEPEPEPERQPGVFRDLDY